MLACGGEAVPDLGLRGLISGSDCNIGDIDDCWAEVGAVDILSLVFALKFVEDGGSV
jgi:hypothetical protein